MLNWYLLYTKPNCEEMLEKRFASTGFETLNPKLKERRYVGNRLTDSVSPLFACYIFVKFNFPDDYRLVKYTRGVKSVVGGEGTPIPVPCEVINSIIDRMEDDGVVTIGSSSFEEGDDVLIKKGTFADFEAVFEKELKGMERVSVLIKAINLRATIDGYSIEKR